MSSEILSVLVKPGNELAFQRFLREIAGNDVADKARIRAAEEGVMDHRLPTITTKHNTYEGWEDVNEFLETIDVT
jgi:hypothetical protein